MELFPQKILLGLQEGHCNLRCPKCYTYGTNSVSANHRSQGTMKYEDLISLLDEVKVWKPRIAPQTWDEPLMNPKLLLYLEEIKKRDLVITMDTNGLLMTDEIMKELVSLKVDSVFFSVDAATDETFKKVRGVNRLPFLKERIFKLINLRGTSLFPRIGVSFVSEEDNASETAAFVSYWSNHVDVIRVNQKFLQDRKLTLSPSGKRSACWSLYDSLMVHHNGEAAMCCVDTHYENKIGNVFSSGVKSVWNGVFFKQVRSLHETGQADQVSICSKCELWSHDEPQNRIEDNLIISETNSHTYYNRIDRMQNLAKNRFL